MAMLTKVRFYAPSLTCPGRFFALRTSGYVSAANPLQAEKPSGLLELLLDGSGSCRAGRPLVRHTALRREKLSGQIGEDRVRGGKFFVRRLFEGYPQLLAPPDEPPDCPVRLPERHPPRRQIVRELGRQRQAARRHPHALPIERGGA